MGGEDARRYSKRLFTKFKIITYILQAAIGKDANFSFKTRGLNVDVISLPKEWIEMNEQIFTLVF